MRCTSAALALVMPGCINSFRNASAPLAVIRFFTPGGSTGTDRTTGSGSGTPASSRVNALLMRTRYHTCAEAYRHKRATGKGFALYSIGWDETDDDCHPASSDWPSLKKETGCGRIPRAIE